MTVQLLHLNNIPIFEQLQIEEALLRQCSQNYCIINIGSPPAIVMGISGKVDELIDPQAFHDNIPVIRRFSGGGTVFVDPDTIFITFISPKEIHSFPAFPEQIMRWSGSLYHEVFNHSLFALRDNDYVLGEHKCGGNAQYIKKNRWLHHTSFLWDYQESNMNYLLHPKKTPAYRKDRSHNDFLCRLKEHFSSKEAFLESFKRALSQRYELQTICLDEIQTILFQEHRRSSIILN